MYTSTRLHLEFFHDMDHVKQEQSAQLISELSKGQTSHESRMVPLEPDDVLEKYLGLLATKKTDFAGYISAAPLVDFKDYKMSKVGSLVVAETHQNEGVGSILVKTITKRLETEKIIPFAFCNLRSVFAFFKAGYKPVSEGDLPPGQHSPYGNLGVFYPWHIPKPVPYSIPDHRDH